MGFRRPAGDTSRGGFNGRTRGARQGHRLGFPADAAGFMPRSPCARANGVPPVSKRFVTGVALTGVSGAAFLGAALALNRPGDGYAFFDPIIEVKAIIDRGYVGELSEEDQRRMQDGAIAGMIEALGDPFTVYVPGDVSADFQKDLTGEYVGIGASVNVRDGWLTIVSPLEDSPAYRAGIMAEDRVVEIEGESTQGLSADACVDRLMGVAGTSVTFVIERAGVRLPPFTLVREHIKTRSVKGFHRNPADPEQWEFMIDPARGIAYIRLTQFTPQCALEVAEALQAAGAWSGGVKGLVLDLRNNPGGLLDDAVSIADLFLASGRIVSTEGRGGPSRIEDAVAPGTLPDFPVAVLLNGSSASASEVLAGALADNHRATIIGSRSFGKGSVQSVIPLVRGGEGAQLKVTEQYYYLPSGRLLHRKPDSVVWGVDPTPGFHIPTTPQQELAMFLARRDQEVIRAGAAPDDENWSDPEWIVTKLQDQQLAGAIRAMQARLDTGEWLKTGDDPEAGSAIAFGEIRDLERTQEAHAREIERIQKRIDALSSAAAGVETAPPDFWADDTDLTGGTLDVFDKDGKKITSLRITGNSLERWLMSADVEKQ